MIIRWKGMLAAASALMLFACGTAGNGGLDLSSLDGPESPEAPATLAGPAQKRPIDLETALRLATASHLDIEEAQARYREAKGRLEEALGDLLPTVAVGAEVGRMNGMKQGSFGDLRDVRYDSASAAGTARLSWDLAEAVFHSLAASRSAGAASQAVEVARQKTLRSVAELYLDLVEATALVRVREQSAADTAAILRIAEARERQGVGSALDTARARAAASAARRELSAARDVRQEAAKALAAELRLDPRVDLVPVDVDLQPASLVDSDISLDDWIARALRLRPELATFEDLRAAADHEARARFWSILAPEVVAAGSHGELGEELDDMDESRRWSVLLGWSVGAGDFGRIRSAEARSEQARISAERFRDRLRASVAGAFEKIGLNRQEVGHAEAEAKSAEQALRLARAQFEGGILPEAELLQAQGAADRARLKRLSAVVGYNKAQIRLLSEAGLASQAAFVKTKP